jgi:hypothetical protein
VITVVLAVLIGTAGAFLLPVLIHEAEPPAPTGFRAEIGFVVPDGGLPRGGVFHVFATHPTGTLVNVVEPIPQGATREAVVGLLADAIGSPPWPEDAAPTVAGHQVSFPLVTTIGGAPGDVGVPMSLAAASGPDEGLRLRIRQRTGAAEAPGRVRLGLSARGVVRRDGNAGSSASHTASTEWTRYGEGLAQLTTRLEKAGWQASRDASGDLLLLVLPEGAGIGSVILTVEYAEAVPPVHDWSLEMLP